MLLSSRNESAQYCSGPLSPRRARHRAESVFQSPRAVDRNRMTGQSKCPSVFFFSPSFLPDNYYCYLIRTPIVCVCVLFLRGVSAGRIIPLELGHSTTGWVRTKFLLGANTSVCTLVFYSVRAKKCPQRPFRGTKGGTKMSAISRTAYVWT